jgi:glycosyltransferase involved in cell wall biosynthesis
LYHKTDGGTSGRERWRERLERRAIRRADRAYAPSKLVSNHFREQHGIEVAVLRPPVSLETAPAPEVPFGLPEKYLLHFGQFMRRKGSHWIAKSLEIAFAREPSLRMVWVGTTGDHLGKVLSGLSDHRSKLLVLHPLPKPELYAIVRRATASVQPSLVDNLPNTVIESLMLGVPVIGSRGGSIDELVEDGVTGMLVSMNDVEGLANAMVNMYRGQTSVRKGFTWQGGIAEEMQPDRAVQNFLDFAASTAKRALGPKSPRPQTAGPSARLAHRSIL